MIKKLLMIFLFLAFICGILLLLFFGKGYLSAPSISLPVPAFQPSPIIEASPSAVPNVQIIDVENDLRLIENDLQKIKEDARLNPPKFLFKLGITK